MLRYCYLHLGYDNGNYFYARTWINEHFGMNSTEKKEEWDQPTFLNEKKLKETAEKLKSGELTCNLDAPEDCESCSG